MTIVDFLNSLKDFIKENVADKIELQKEVTEQDDTDYIEYVNPYVEICYLPHKNFSPNNFQVPLILISIDDGEDGTGEHTALIRLTLATYGGGFYEDSNIPDAKGYIDLLNLMEFTRQALINNTVINNMGRVLLPINYGMYDTELIYPYWYGYITFTASIQATEYLLNF